MNFLKFPVKESIHKKLSSFSCSGFYGKIYAMKNHYTVQVTPKEVFFSRRMLYAVCCITLAVFFNAGGWPFHVGCRFFTFGFHIGCFHIGGVLFHVWVCFFALVPFTLGAFHMGFSTDVLVDLDEGQGSGSSEHETTTESSMLPTTTIGI